MFIVKLMKYEESQVGSPAAVKTQSIREADTVHVITERDGRQVLQLGDAPGETMELTVGNRPDCSYHIAYVMNSSGKTVETIR